MGFWCWVQRNHDVLQTLGAWAGVIVAAAGVVVAIRYVILTRRLAEAAHVQATASRIAAQAGEAQAQSTRLIFEAAHRPYLQVALHGDSSFFFKPDFYRFFYTVKNHGPIPAILADRHLTVRMSGQEVLQLPPAAAVATRAIFPGGEIRVEWELFQQGKPQEWPLVPVEVECTVRYRGLSGFTYMTRVVAESRPGPHRAWSASRIEME
jgi:hypothetical protein